MPSTAKRIAVEYVKYLSGLTHRRRMYSLASLSPTQFYEYQTRQLAAHYERAKKDVPFYSSDDRYPLRLPQATGTSEQLAKLPILKKSDVKLDPARFYTSRPGLLVAYHTTGGTTGSPLKIRAGLFERGATNAILEDRNRAITGKKNPRILRLSGFLDNPDRVWLNIPGTNIAYLSIYQLNATRRAEIVDRISTFSPELLHGYASAHLQLARLVAGTKIDLTQAAIVSTSETLEPGVRFEIEQALGARVHNEYGSQEGQHLILECRERGMHIHPARGIVELLKLDSDDAVAPGDIGRVVVTGLLSRQMPLFRYDIGDTAESTGFEVGCKCGSGWPTIGQVFGRSEDLVRTRDGRSIGMLSYSTLKDIRGINLSQIRQTALDSFELIIEPGPTYCSEQAEPEISNKIEKRIGYPCNIRFVYDQTVPRTVSGKVRAVVVDLNP